MSKSVEFSSSFFLAFYYRRKWIQVCIMYQKPSVVNKITWVDGQTMCTRKQHILLSIFLMLLLHPHFIGKLFFNKIWWPKKIEKYSVFGIQNNFLTVLLTIFASTHKGNPSIILFVNQINIEFENERSSQCFKITQNVTFEFWHLPPIFVL